MKYPSPTFEGKCCAPDSLAEHIARLPRPLVFTNGCFDILHRGHVSYLAQARADIDAMLQAAWAGSLPDPQALSKALSAVTSDSTAAGLPSAIF